MGGNRTGAGSTRRRCAARTGVFVGTVGQEYGNVAGQGPPRDVADLVTGDRERRVGPDRLHVRAARPALYDRHCVLVVARRDACGVAGAAFGDCHMALACGVTVMATHGMYVAIAGIMGSPRRPLQGVRGGTDGTGWSEGAGMLVLERASRAAATPPRARRRGRLGGGGEAPPPRMSGSRRGSHPPAPADPGVTISRHRALVILTTRNRAPMPSGRRAGDAGG